MKKINLIYSLSFIFFLVINLSTEGQSTKIRGKVTDAQTKELLPFVNIFLKGTNQRTITDYNGEFYIETRMPVDTLVVTYMGYKRQKYYVKKNQYQEINIELENDTYVLREVVIHPTENPAHRIIRNIIAHKKKNNPDKLTGYSAEVYNKMEFDVNNIDNKFKKQAVFKQFQFIFNYVDTSAETGKVFLPVFLTESLSDYYYQKNPKRTKEIIKASHISGVENTSISQFTGQMYIDANVYDNYINAFDKNFFSPIADFGLFVYKYYLLDSTYIDNVRCYHISFKPKRKQELTFTGDFWVADSSWAIKKINARIAEDANINFINNLTVSQEFSKLNDSTWFLVKDQEFADFSVEKKAIGLFGRKTTSFKNIKLGVPDSKRFFTNEIPEQSIVLKDATRKDTAFWNNSRHEHLTKKEEDIYAMVDSIRKVPVFNTYVELITTFVTGYYVHGPFEFGPYFKTASFNPIEGERLRLGLRTSNDFSTRIMLSGHIAYGFKDEKLKYGIGTMYMLNKSPREVLAFNYKDDIEQLGQSINAFTEDNILASILARRPKNKLLMVREFESYYEKEWFEGLSSTLRFSNKIIFPSEIIPFENTQDSRNWSRITSSEITLTTRFAYNEKFMNGEFERTSMGSDYPILKIDFTKGLKGVLNSDYKYYKLHLDITHSFKINPLGTFNYEIQAGKIWGKLPYPLLRLHEGNETFAFDASSFNMMNYYEFVSDRYASLFAEHHFEGLFLNHIPLMRKLKWREVVYGKGLIGSLNKETKGIMDFPSTLSGLSKPYAEGGLGIENIFKIIRVDAIWRFSYLNHPDIQRFGLRVGLQLIF